MEKPGSRFIQIISQGWPLILANVKSLLETGESLIETRTCRMRCAAQEKRPATGGRSLALLMGQGEGNGGV